MDAISPTTWTLTSQNNITAGQTPNVTKPRLPQVGQIEEDATNAGFNVTRVQALRPLYAKTLDIWAANLQSNTDEAIAITSEGVYERYMKYRSAVLTCSARATPMSASSVAKRHGSAGRRN